MTRHLLREILRQLRESGGAGAVAVLMVLLATVLAGTLLSVRAWVLTELLDTDRTGTVAATLTGPAQAAALTESMRTHFPEAEGTVLPPAAVRAQLASWFPHLAGVLSAISLDSYPTLFLVEVAGHQEESLSLWLAQQPSVGLATGSQLWQKPLQRMLSRALAGGFALTAVLLVGCGMVVLLVVRLMVLGHADEIEIMRLIGARERDIRIPYLVSGAVLGGVGSTLGGGGLLVLPKALAGGLPIQELPGETILLLVATGPLVATMGALLGLASLPREP